MALRDVLLEKRARAELERSQWLPLEKLEALQMRRLKALLKHAYETVLYYHRRFNEVKVRPEDIRSFDDLSKLPVLEKEDVRNCAQEMVSSKYDVKELLEKKTSGSTSLPLTVYATKEQICYHHANKFRNLDWLGVMEKEFSVYVGAPGIDIYPRNIPDALRMDSFGIDSGKLERLVQNIRNMRPRHVWGFPSGLNLLTRFCEERGINDIAFETIQCTGESLFDREKERMKKTFGAGVYQMYAATDTRMIAGDCSEHTGLHICSETVLVEFLKDGEHAAEGEFASVVVTPLLSYGMPLIRYNLDDVASRIDDSCACGRKLPLMSYVDGRTVDILVTGDGRWLGYSNFHSRIFDHIDVQQYRITQESINSIMVELIPGKKYGDKAERFIVSSIKKHMGDNVDVVVQVVNDLESPL